MTDITQESATKQAAKPKAPTHIAFHVRDTKDGKGFWTRIGSAWANKDGKGFNVQIDIFPLDGCITLRVPEEKNRQ
jgi:hypothetical protein